MGNHRGEQISTALRGALQSDDPAYQLAAMNSLRQATGTDQGNSADAWVVTSIKILSSIVNPKGSLIASKTSSNTSSSDATSLAFLPCQNRLFSLFFLAYDGQI